ncbi:MAG: heme-binding protein [Chloroflexi bacterium HGW-Chloroflexi-4]|jgi:glc operon protein GlcG|nr:MAG: heme-binding protein [Chloroflexi bacterium HGW-Chloroflexi-4]
MNNITCLGHQEAEKIIETIKNELKRRQKSAVISVVDHHGELIAFLRMDGAPLPSITIATNKAFTAAREQKPTLEYGQAARDPNNGFDVAYMGDSRFTGFGGGIPVKFDGKVAGGIGVSGLVTEEDIELAMMGLASIQK